MVVEDGIGRVKGKQKTLDGEVTSSTQTVTVSEQDPVDIDIADDARDAVDPNEP
jgi:hypothetical protein